jgi:hypothetical protein
MSLRKNFPKNQVIQEKLHFPNVENETSVRLLGFFFVGAAVKLYVSQPTFSAIHPTGSTPRRRSPKGTGVAGNFETAKILAAV